MASSYVSSVISKSFIMYNIFSEIYIVIDSYA